MLSFKFAILAQVDSASLESIRECTGSLFGVDSLALNCGAAMSKYTAATWDQNWQEKVAVASPEFIALLNISRYIAGPMIGLWAYRALNNFYRNGLANGVTELAIALILIFGLYANDGLVVRNSALAVRALFNHQNTLILEMANSASNYEARLYEISNYVLTEQALVEARSQCNGITNNDELFACYQAAEVRAQDVLESYTAAEGTSLWLARLNDYAQRTISNVLQDPQANNNLTGVNANPIIQIVLEGVLASINSVIQNLVELAWLLTAIIAPIPIALSFYPGGRGAMISWAIAFLSPGLFKINLNIATATVVTMMYNRGPTDQLGDLILLTIGVPLLASAMTAGGGLAIMNGITSAIAGVTMGILRLSTNASQKGSG